MRCERICRRMLLSVASVCVLQATAAADTLTEMEVLGKFLFYQGISTPGSMSCAVCHGPGVGFTGPDAEINRHGTVYRGAVPERFGNRKPPSSAYATFSPVLHYDEKKGFVGGNFWDGRATGKHLGNPAADQAQGPFLNPVEQNNPDKKTVLEKVKASSYGPLWQKVWGEPLSLETQQAIDLNYDRVGRAIAAYEGSREMSPFSSKYDYYLRGLVQLSPQEQQGLTLFNGKGNCSSCHTSKAGPKGEPPLFTDFTYANLGVPKNPENPYYRMDRVSVARQTDQSGRGQLGRPGPGGFSADFGRSRLAQQGPARAGASTKCRPCGTWTSGPAPTFRKPTCTTASSNPSKRWSTSTTPGMFPAQAGRLPKCRRMSIPSRRATSNSRPRRRRPS